MAYGATASTAGPSRSRLGLTRQAIVEAAFELLTEDGLGGFTMQRLAQRLGIGTMTLYGYFREKDELVDAVIELGGERVTVPDAEGPWRDRLRALMEAFHANLRAHPFLVELRLRRPIATPAALRWTEVGLAILTEAGLSRADAAQAYRMLFVYAFGDVAFGPAGPERAPRPGHPPRPALPASDYAHVRGSGAELIEAFTGEESFAAGLEYLLDAIESRVPDP